MAVGGQAGNTNARKGKVWQQAIDRALKKRSKVAEAQELDILAEKLLDLCKEGSLPALQELGNRLDGKPAQSLTLSGDEDAPLVTVIERHIVNTKD